MQIVGFWTGERHIGQGSGKKPVFTLPPIPHFGASLHAIALLFPRDGKTLPRLRFPEFRNAPNWDLRKIGDVLDEVARPIAMDDQEEYSLVTVKRRYGGVVFRERLKGRAIKVKSQFVVKAGDFLISKRQIVHNACGVVPLDLDGSIVSNEYSVLGPKAGSDIRVVPSAKLLIS